LRWRKKTDEERIRDIAEAWPWTDEKNADGLTVWRANAWSITEPSGGGLLGSLYYVSGPGSALDPHNMTHTETLDGAKDAAVRGYLHEKAAAELRRRVAGR
jgi:hypothetical protein